MKSFRILTVLMLLVLPFQAGAVMVGGNDWLQVTATTYFSWNQMDSIFNTTNGQCDVTDCILGTGSSAVNLTGYTWASNADVDSMIQMLNGGIGLPSLTSNSSVSAGVNGLDSLFAAFTRTWSSANTEQIVAWTRNNSFGLGYSDYISVVRFRGRSDNLNDSYGLNTQYDANYRNYSFGGWFYKSASVPEPSTLALLSLGFIGIGAARKLNKN